MSNNSLNGKESSASTNTTQRRTFLKRASAGAAIASIPWAFSLG
ncbi:twin-arginine translocation signal domain-containing protein [Paraglaciecola aquimarina]|uniref:Twin-arginine translocation signal domain-containing protein n=1 Tax=Paraglaciecola aquimarina TaxID=1235557 RepID=A0ABU3T260_9ALTE|nr:twin-arginine translocation signal domain-containing protein [Paraglaciecola aquimarina]MDU0356340.1 twin-arginine translocation signal domain-containing protein [Paraglaciecola aquimarina]